MYRRIEDFTFEELLERTTLQEHIAITLRALQDALDKKEYNRALFYNLQGHRMISVLVDRQLAIKDEYAMLTVLHNTAQDVLRLQHRLQ